MRVQAGNEPRYLSWKLVMMQLRAVYVTSEASTEIDVDARTAFV